MYSNLTVMECLFPIYIYSRLKRHSHCESAKRENSTDTNDFTNAHRAQHLCLPPRNVPRVITAHLGVHNCGSHDWQLQSATSSVHSGGCSRGNAMDNGTYSKLNHFPGCTHPRQSLTRSSTSSTNSNSPLLHSHSSSSSADDSVFVTGTLSHISVISTLPEQVETSSQRQGSTGTHSHMQAVQTPQYLELRADSMDPPSHYETIQ